MIMKSQNATATIGNVTTCAGEDILVPLDVTNFIEVGAMTIYIGYDTNATEFLSLQNINPAVPGFITYNASNGQINIAYSNTNPFSLSDDKLFDLEFTFFGDSTLLPFNPGSEIANTNLEIIPLETFPGSIANSILLIDQPENVQSYPDNDVIFRVTSLGTPNYQWQENTGSGWADLQENEIYSGVTDDTLNIYDVPLSFNGYHYRCVLTAGECTVISDAALLEVATAFPVATLGYISSCPEMEILEPLFVGDFLDVVEFTFNISFNPAYLTFITLENIHTDLLPGILTTSPLTDPPGIVIHWESTIPVSITSGKLFDLRFAYESLNHTLSFEEGSVVLNSFSNPVNIMLNNGTVNQYPTPLITSQPQNDSVVEEEDAMFTVETSGTDEYLWQISTDGGDNWTSLTNTIPYYYVNTATLTISPVTYSMNGHLFACRLDNGYCTVYSSSALLNVDTLTYINTLDQKELFQVHPVPFRDRLHVSLPAYFPCNLINIYDTRGILVNSVKINQTKDSQEISLDLSALQVGVYFLQASGNLNGHATIESKIILKTK
jgi:hypothetical protein